MRLRFWLAAGLCVSQAGCFHQVFSTGLPAGTTGVTQSWHPTFIFGLVAAKPIDVRTVCPSGVAIASTRMTFANGLVGGLTLGIFTPHEVKVVCASSSASVPVLETRHIALDASRDESVRIMAGAIETARRREGNVAIHFTPIQTDDMHTEAGR